MYQRILIAAALASTLLAGSAAAACNSGGGGCGGMMNQPNPGMQKGMKRGGMQSQQAMQKQFLQNVINAVSRCGIDAAQTKKVTDAVNTFKKAQMQMKRQRQMPLAAFKGESFDKGLFAEILLAKPTAKATAKGDLLEAIYAVLDTEQAKIFTREFTAPMVRRMITQNMIKGGMSMRQGGAGCGGKGSGGGRR